MTGSDEPTKIASIVVPLHADEDLARFELTNSATSELLLGVVAQDDCAAYALSGEQTLVVGTDYVRGPKFALYEAGLLSDYDIGWYLAGANLSDVAAMGAQPIGLVSVIRYLKDSPDHVFEDLVRGVRDSCRSVGAKNVGGDIGTAERIILSASGFGVVEPGRVLTRSAARPGQAVVLTGATGLAGSVMKYMTSGSHNTRVPPNSLETLLHKWRRVTPRVAHGRLLAGEPGASACIDTSDGLAGAIKTMCAASGVGMTIYEEAMPLHPDVALVAQSLGTDIWDLVFGDSVDFELLATVDAECLDDLATKIADAGLELHVIGEVTNSGSAVLRRGGASREVPGIPWTHTS